MILVAVLIGGALFFVLWVLFGQPVVVAVAGAFFVLVLIGVASDVRWHHHDRSTTKRRLREMRDNDALNRILGEHPRG